MKKLISFHGKHWLNRVLMIALCLFAMQNGEASPFYSMQKDESSTQQKKGDQALSVKEVFNYIEQHSNYAFLYGEGVEKKLSKRVSVETKDRIVEQILEDLCNSADLDYKINGRQITITNRTSQKNQKTGAVTDVKPSFVKGVVTDEEGEPLIGATIKVKDSKAVAVTDLDGNFTIEAKPGQKLLISYIGFQPTEVSASGSPLDVKLSSSISDLDEVVVIGYGTVKKKDLTGSVSAIKGEDLTSKKTTNLSTSLQGSVAGLMVRRDNNAPGASASSMHIRGVTTIGDSSPLILVDGVPCDNIDYVNPNDVENVTVLKDAAAASIYGSKAASGVILITTKRGNETSLNISYTGEFGWQVPTS